MAYIKKDGSSMGLPMNIRRSNPIPIDTSAVWYSLAAATRYAKNDKTAYVGQILSVVNETSQTATAYIIKDLDGNLKEIGTISLDEYVTKTEFNESISDINTAYSKADKDIQEQLNNMDDKLDSIIEENFEEIGKSRIEELFN